jgi:hypothetical protein
MQHPVDEAALRSLIGRFNNRFDLKAREPLAQSRSADGGTHVAT